MIERELDIIEWLGLDPGFEGGWTTRGIIRLLCRWFEGRACWFVVQKNDRAEYCRNLFEGYLEELMTSGFFEETVTVDQEHLPIFWSRPVGGPGAASDIEERFFQKALIRDLSYASEPGIWPIRSRVVGSPRVAEITTSNIPLYFLTRQKPIPVLPGLRCSMRSPNTDHGVLILDNEYMEALLRQPHHRTHVEVLDLIGGDFA